MSAQYPTTFDQHDRPLDEKAARMQDSGNRFFSRGLPQLCQVCQIPMLFSEPGDPTRVAFRVSEYRGERFNTCSDGCQWIFEREPAKYVQAWLPVHQIYQGNCGGATIPDVLSWYGYELGRDNGEYAGSVDQQNWAKWHTEGGV